MSYVHSLRALIIAGAESIKVETRRSTQRPNLYVNYQVLQFINTSLL